MAEIALLNEHLRPILKEILRDDAWDLTLGVDHSQLLLRDLSHARVID